MLKRNKSDEDEVNCSMMKVIKRNDNENQFNTLIFFRLNINLNYIIIF